MSPGLGSGAFVSGYSSFRCQSLYRLGLLDFGVSSSRPKVQDLGFGLQRKIYKEELFHSCLNSRLLGYVTIGYIEPGTQYSGNREPQGSTPFKYFRCEPRLGGPSIADCHLYNLESRITIKMYVLTVTMSNLSRVLEVGRLTSSILRKALPVLQFAGESS